MILIADGGSTKVDWCLVEKGKGAVKRVLTKGANPFIRSSEDIAAELKEVLVPELKGYKIDEVHFFGAGCAFGKEEFIRTAIAVNFDVPKEKIEVASDMLGAAIGLFGSKPGIACILGTGSNSCFYDGEKMAANVSPLGFILGDEGSGAVLGKLFIGACLKNQLTPGLKERFFEFIKIEQGDIIDKVYRQPMPNRFLATVSPFIKENLSDPTVYALVHGAFTDFFKRNVMQYEYKGNKVSFIGSVAYYYKDILTKTAADLGIEIGSIEQSPMDGLVEYYK